MNKKIVAEMVDLYWELETIIQAVEGTKDDELITSLKDIQLRLDERLTNVSKRWAKGKKEPK